MRTLFPFSEVLIARFLVVGATYLFLAIQYVAAAEFTLEQVRAAVTDSVSSIQSLHAIHSITTTKSTNRAVATWNYECWIEGRKSALAIRTDDNEHPLTTVKAYDGEWTQIAILTVDSNGNPSKLQRYRGYHAEELPSSDLAIAVGLQLPNTPSSIVDAMQGGILIVGTEVVANAHCVKVEFPRIAGHGKGAWRAVAAFDVDHRFILRDLQWFAHPDHPIFDSLQKNHGGGPFYSIHIDEISSATDGTEGNLRWLPKHAIIKTLFTRSEFNLSAGEINLSIAGDQFTLAPEYGAEVFEGEFRNDPAGKRWIAGGDQAVQEHRARIVERARRVSAQRKVATMQPKSGSVPYVNAVPKTSFPYWWFVVAISVALIATGAVIARRG